MKVILKGNKTKYHKVKQKTLTNSVPESTYDLSHVQHNYILGTFILTTNSSFQPPR